MIYITKKHNCCGCNACLQVCPKECIVMREDNEGFLYPDVDQSICIDCHLCEKVCPVLNQGEPRKPLKVYAAKNRNEEIRRQSSSGGIFSLLAEQVIDGGGVVFGARFDENWEVKHDYTETMEGLVAFRGSKYVQSRMENNYKKAENFLKQGRKVLFSGTPCQIAGLKRFLRKEYENLLTVDFICHGVPSPKVWRMYLDETIARQGVGKNTVSSHPIDRKKFIRSIEFRSKSMGWKKYSFALTLSEAIDEGEKNSVLLSSVHTENLYMKGFLSNLILRPSCYQCPSKSFKSSSDLTLADFWGCNKFYPDFDDDKGISLLFIHNEKYIPYHLPVVQLEVSLEQALNQNPAIIKSCRYRNNRQLFMERLGSKDISYLISKYAKWDMKERTRLGLISFLVKLQLLSFFKKVLRK